VERAHTWDTDGLGFFEQGGGPLGVTRDQGHGQGLQVERDGTRHAPTESGGAIEGYLALARIFLPRGRRLATQTDHPWPEAYERASVSYFERSLGVVIGV
jgi:hypothetical protein